MRYFNFLTLCVALGSSLAYAAPSTPVLTAPTGNAVAPIQYANFSWYATGATEYRIVISSDPSFRGFDETTRTCNSAQYPCFTQGGITSNGYTHQSRFNAYDTTYYWKVRANNSATSEASGWSSIGSFRTEAQVQPPSTPVLYSPLNNTVVPVSNASFSWSGSGATEYRILISTDPLFRGFDETTRSCNSTQYPCFTQGGITSNGYTHNATFNGYNTVYYWKVRANNTNTSMASDWSSAGSFQTESAPPVPPSIPSLISPVNSQKTPLTGAIFRWDASNADTYRIVISRDSAFRGFDEATLTCNSTTYPCYTKGGLTTKSYTHNETFSQGNTTYYWKVRANNSSISQASAWSPAGAFITEAPLSQKIAKSSCPSHRGSFTGAVAGKRYNIPVECFTDYGWAHPLGTLPLTSSTNYDYKSQFYTYAWKPHGGVDLVGESTATRVYAIDDGTVVAVTRNDNANNTSNVVVQHVAADGTVFYVTYGHVYSNWQINRPISKGAFIGTLRKYGTPIHLHLEVNTSKYSSFGKVKPNTQIPTYFLIDHPNQ